MTVTHDINEGEVLVVGTPGATPTRPATPPAWMVHGALIAAQLSFGGGAVVGKLGVSGTNPVLFALIREGLAGPLLCGLALMQRVEIPHRSDVMRLLLAGFCIFMNQFCFIVGLKLTDPTTGSVWQPSQPIFTTALALLLRYEQPDLLKILGILFAVAGASVMVLVPSGSDGSSDGNGSSSSGDGATHNPGVGNLLFFLNCLGTSCYVILTKPLLARGVYLPISVTGWAYIIASVMMMVTAVVINTNDTMLDFVCPKHDCQGAWTVPTSMILALAYWVFFNSILAYACMTWANAYAKASVVSAYTVLQPVTSALLSVLIIASKGHHWAVDDKGFEEPGLNDLGAIGVVIGLVLVVWKKTMDDPTGAHYDQASEYVSESEDSGVY
eukprot:TRINITY_DN14942_c0_g2_i1.p1 TRINITY_DN14942_c0_g2~~TRINITY_DN14942_c0_g2_i1.p1  ORF type:complete len:429 (+),score=126.14 TRINITY_DN14942_c0_g2_i1:138-1289(+)